MQPQKFKEIINQIKSVKVYHNRALKDLSYVVWYEVGRTDLQADRETAEVAKRYAVDFYTKDEYSVVPEEIEKVFKDNLILITDYAVDYEEDTGYTHYAYTVEA